MTSKEFYIKYVDKPINCFFCDNEGRFISCDKGFKNLCRDKKCVSKARSTSNIETIMYINNCDKDTAIKIKYENDLSRSNKCKQHNKKQLQKNKNYTKENSSWCKEYWMKHHNYSEEEAIQKISNIQKENNRKVKNRRNGATLDLWLERGYSEEEAKIIIRKI